MSTEGGSADGLLSMSYEDFAKIRLPLYHGPIVCINIGATTYNVSKELLCKHSPYFTAMFKGKFKEAEEQSAELEELDGVVSNRSFSLLLQWLYLGRFILGEESPSDRITAMFQLARLGDMLKITGMDLQIVECIRATILDNPHPDNFLTTNPDINIYHMTPEHVDAASHLPKGHMVRLLPAKAAVHAYLHSDNFKFSKETQDVPEFAADLLEALTVALKSFEYKKYCTYKDPFTEERLPFRK